MLPNNNINNNNNSTIWYGNFAHWKCLERKSLYLFSLHRAIIFYWWKIFPQKKRKEMFSFGINNNCFKYRPGVDLQNLHILITTPEKFKDSFVNQFISLNINYKGLSLSFFSVSYFFFVFSDATTSMNTQKKKENYY